MSIDDLQKPDSRKSIKIIGVGGAGCKAISLLMEANLPDCELIAVDTDWASVRISNACRNLELHHASIYGHGSGGNRGWAERCAEVSRDELHNVIYPADLCLIIAGMGGGTGTGAAPVIARITGEAGIPTLSVVTMPLDLEGPRRSLIAREGLDTLSNENAGVFVIELRQIVMETGQKISLANYYTTADRVLRDCILYLIGHSDVTEFAGLHVRISQVNKDSEGTTCGRLPVWIVNRLEKLLLNHDD